MNNCRTVVTCLFTQVHCGAKSLYQSMLMFYYLGSQTDWGLCGMVL